ncbi:MAG: hypothetical protein U5N21_24890 [Rhodococcus sp. (in: high G+C Gram-positive bacteria)]|nr:hypothetical protein [Rhodococcus sp. (in: high G+C Gram-positive bacteria)]
MKFVVPVLEHRDRTGRTPMILTRGYGLPQDHFTIVPNGWLRDARLSRRARGLLFELMSHEPGWETSAERLAKAGTEGVAALKAALKELEACGYLVRETTRDGRGRLTGTRYIITDPATTENASSEPSVGNRPKDEPDVEPSVDSPSVDLPPAATPSVANRTPKKNNYKKTINQEEKGKKKPPPPPEESHQPREDGATRRRPIVELETAIRNENLSARFDKLSHDDHTAIISLIDVHGIPALVAVAKFSHRADDPARFAQAWIPAWSNLPAPRSSSTAPSWTSCGKCDPNGWVETDDGSARKRCHCHPRSSGGAR